MAPSLKFSIPFAGFDSPPDRSRLGCFSQLYAPFGSSQCFQQEADTLLLKIPVEKISHHKLPGNLDRSDL